MVFYSKKYNQKSNNVKYKIELLSDTKLPCGEGPAWDNKDCLYFTDSLGESIYRYNFAHHLTGLYHHGIHAASITMHKSGGLLICGKDGFSLLSNEKKVDRNYDTSGNIKAHHLNDIIAECTGRVFAGQEVFTDEKPYKPGYLFRLDTDGSLHVVDEGFHIANGMGFSPDNKTFYIADTIIRTIYKYDYNVENGTLLNKKVLIQFDKEDGLPDGLTVDSAGCLWVAMFLGNQLICVDADGIIKERIELPFAQPTSVTFGGKDLDELYVTSAALNWVTLLAPSKHDYNISRGGQLYSIKMGVQGKLEYKAGI